MLSSHYNLLFKQLAADSANRVKNNEDVKGELRNAK